MNPIARRARPASVLCLAALIALMLAACSRPQTEHFSGYAQADLVYVAAPVAGRLQALAVQRGGTVAADAPLYMLDPDPEAYARGAAAARAESAAAQAANLKSGKRADELRVIEQQRAQAQAALELSTAELERNRKLVAQGFIAPIQLEVLTTARERDLARVAEREADLRVARQAARPDEIAAAAAAQRAAQSELDSARWRVTQTQQRAPTAAQVFDTLYRVGEWVPAGAPVVALLPPGALKVVFFIPEPALARVAVGARVAFACDSCPADLAGQVSFISPQAEYTPPVIYSNESRARLVFLAEARPDAATAGRLKPGQPVSVRLAAAGP
jgi:HlyD family secretion protein